MTLLFRNPTAGTPAIRVAAEMSGAKNAGVIAICSHEADRSTMTYYDIVNPYDSGTLLSY